MDKDINFNKMLLTKNDSVVSFSKKFVNCLTGYQKPFKEKCINNIICNLSSDAEIRIDLNKNKYIKVNQYKNNLPYYKYSIMTEVIYKLKERGFIILNEAPDYRFGISSTIEPTEKLWLFVDKKFKMYNEKLFNPLILRKVTKTCNKGVTKKTYELVDYIDDRTSIKMKKNLNNYNNLIDKTNIEIKIPFKKITNFNSKELKWIIKNMLNISNKELKERLNIPLGMGERERGEGISKYVLCNTICPENNLLQRINIVSKPLKKGQKRTFLKKWEITQKWGNGGRFYDRFIQTVPKKIREFVLINGKKTIELDYSGNHINLLYNTEGISYKGDPYKSKYRDLVKLVSLICLNEDSKRGAIKAIQMKFKKIRFDYNYDFDITNIIFIKKLINEFECLHKPIKKYFYSGIGINLQALEANIMEEILNYFTEKNIPVIPIHDSIIIEEIYKKLAVEIMNEKYEEKIGYKPIIK